MIGDTYESDGRPRPGDDGWRPGRRLVDTGAGMADAGGVEVAGGCPTARRHQSRECGCWPGMTPPTPIWRRTSTAMGGARKKNGLRGSGHRWPWSKMAPSRLSTNRSASAMTATRSSLKSLGGGLDVSRSATPPAEHGVAGQATHRRIALGCVGVRWVTNQSRASPATASSAPGSSNRWVAPGTTTRRASHRSSRLCPAVEVEHDVVVAADDEQGRRSHRIQAAGGEVGASSP